MSQIDTFMHDIYCQEMDENGLPINNIHALKMLHYIDNDEYVFTNPNLKIVDSAKKLWQIHSANGNSLNKKELLNLWGKVNIVNSEGLEIQTNSLAYYRNAQYALTKDPLTITQHGNTMKSIGAKLDFQNGILKLTSHVEGAYDESTLCADQAECHQKEGLCIYSGHVKFNQGTHHVTAPLLHIYQSDTNCITKIVALGKPAHYFTMVNKNQTKVDAKAQTIQFYPLKNLIVLLGKAEINQGQNQFIGEHIEIDTKNQTIFSKPPKDSITTIILQQR